MNAKKTLILFIIVEALVHVGLAQNDSTANVASNRDVLERRVAGDDLRYLTTTRAMREALFVTRTAGGIAAVMDCEEDQATQRWMPAGSSLRNVLDSIVLADPRFQWIVSDGDVVNLVPKDREPALLETRIKSFSLKNVQNVDSALDLLLALPEVKRSEARLHLSTGLKLFVRPNSKNEPEISLSAENVTLRESA